jgi:hypothetical protein
MRETPETMTGLQQIIDRSARTAGPAIARNFIGAGWQMSAEEFVAFWGEAHMASVATVSDVGAVHAVPLDVRLIDGTFHIPTFPDSQRLRDHRANRRCVLNAWDDAYHAVIVYGNARLTDQETTGMMTVEVTPTRIYAIRPPAWHHAAI